MSTKIVDSALARFRSTDVVTRAYAYTSCFIVFMCTLLIFISPDGVIGLGLPIFWTFAVIVLFCAVAYGEDTNASWLSKARLAQFLLLGVSVPVFFEGSNVAARARHRVQGNALLFDDAFIGIDDFLLGAFFPKGQISLWLDTNTVVGVTTPIGHFMNEILQTLYTSYYLWGNLFMVYLAVTYFGCCSSSANANKGAITNRPLPRWQQWRRLTMFVTAWVSTFQFNFLLNTLFPAVSPRIYIKDLYVNEVKGLFLCDILRGALTKAAANSFSAFPSGHCGLSWLTAWLTSTMGFTTYAKITKVAAVLITTATLCLRYHYAVDAICAIFLLTFGVWLGGFTSNEHYQSLVEGSNMIAKLSSPPPRCDIDGSDSTSFPLTTTTTTAGSPTAAASGTAMGSAADRLSASATNALLASDTHLDDFSDVETGGKHY